MSNNQDLSDEELVKKSFTEMDAFGELINRYESKLRNYILRISSFTYEEAEDLVQEIFLKVWKNLRGFDGKLKFSSWIYRITRNHAISSFRKHKSRGYDKNVPLDTSLYDPSIEELAVNDQLDAQQKSDLIKAVISELPKKYKDVLVLKFFEEKSYSEISDILKKPEGTIATLLHRAKKQFKEKVAEKNVKF